jgi:hypothetical protein
MTAHYSQIRRILEWLAVAILLASIVVGALAFAHTWAPQKNAGGEALPRCFSSIWAARFPEWLGCTMAAHEHLAGGLMAGAGALLGLGSRRASYVSRSTMIGGASKINVAGSAKLTSAFANSTCRRL